MKDVCGEGSCSWSSDDDDDDYDAGSWYGWVKACMRVYLLYCIQIYQISPTAPRLA